MKVQILNKNFESPMLGPKSFKLFHGETEKTNFAVAQLKISDDDVCSLKINGYEDRDLSRLSRSDVIKIFGKSIQNSHLQLITIGLKSIDANKRPSLARLDMHFSKSGNVDSYRLWVFETGQTGDVPIR